MAAQKEMYEETGLWLPAERFAYLTCHSEMKPHTNKNTSSRLTRNVYYVVVLVYTSI